MKAAQSFSADFIEKPTFTDQGVQHPLLTILYTEHKLYDDVMNKREPVSEEMFRWLLLRCHPTDNNCESNAIADWLVIGRQAGCRISEYGQDQIELDTTGTHALNVFGDPKAFILTDFKFYKSGGVLIPSTKTDQVPPSDIAAATITWRFQKNGEKNETIWYARNDTQSRNCVIRAMLRIRARALSLNLPNNFPLGVYQNPQLQTCYITNTTVRTHLQAAAHSVHNITDPKRLQKFSSHSIRVWACVLLHSMGKDTSFIKHRLRWKSDAFMEYLRHVPISARHHNEILTDCSFHL